MLNISSYFTLLLLFGLSAGQSFCPPNEEVVECINFCNTCEDGDTWYGEECIPGCDCLPGYLRNDYGECIPRELCPLPEEENYPVCPPNEHFDECFAHCQKNCGNLNQNIICPAVCISGCICNKGLVRGPDNRCVRPEKCPVRPTKGPSLDSIQKDEKRCPINEMFRKCSAHCQRNCSNYDHPAIPCSKKCVSGCVCKTGLVRGPKGNCIPPRNCPSKTLSTFVPKRCKANEEYSLCDAHCQRNCSNYKLPVLTCTKICAPGCVCKKGLVRGPKGDCISPRACPSKGSHIPKRCKVNEEYSLCDAHCQRNCSNYKLPVLTCTKICAPGCVCKKGLVRGPKGDCISPRACPSEGSHKPHRCPIFEEYSKCEAHCQRNCYNYKNTIIPCPKICVRGCVCKQGLPSSTRATIRPRRLLLLTG
ncbi:mucin-19 [Trichonephila clavata]|uniref:Mucin-19 n=1 Tax=Trichonephila clavata TaxID=2740835 RepID=A0A8X6GA01_TRICU|nr:mucin-19 [Trichonephila clavata]